MSVISAQREQKKVIGITKVDPTFGGAMKQPSMSSKAPKSMLKRASSKQSDKKSLIGSAEEAEIASKLSVALSMKMSKMGMSEKTPLQQELDIQTERIMNVLDNTISKIEFAACLSFFFRNNACLLRKHLTPAEVDFVLDVFSEYTTEINSVTLTDRMSKIADEIDKLKPSGKKTSTTDSRVDMMFDPHMMQAFDIVCKNISLLQYVDKFLPMIDGQSRKFLDCMYNLKMAAQQKFSMSAKDVRERTKELRRAWVDNITAKENIANLQNQLSKQRKELGEQLAKKNEILEAYKDKIEELKETFKANIKKRIIHSEQDMMEDNQASEARQTELAVEAKQAQQQYQSLLDQHLAYEKGLRAKRFKVETQLASWVAKYDADMGERQAEFEEITKGYEEEKAEMEALQAKFDEQDEQYEELMAEKEEEEQKIYEEMAYVFLKNRSARIIQRVWRAYRERKRARRKGKKGKKADGPKTPKKKEKVAVKKRSKPELTKKPKLTSKDDPTAMLSNQFKGDVLEDLDRSKSFSKKDVLVDLSGD